MKIYTSYYGNYRNFGDLFPISIALYPSKFFKCFNLKDLAPTKEIFDLKDNQIEYTKKYNQLLSNINAISLYEKINFFSKNKDVVLLCYEKPPKFCHRHIVSEWFKNELGIKIEELNFKIK